MVKIITEKQLVLPALYLINRYNGIDTSTLIKELEQIMHPVGHDLDILSNRNDTHFSQKVRNLKSHDTLQKKDFAKYDNGVFYITSKGCKYINEHMDIIQYLLGNDFVCEDILDAFDDVVDNITNGREPIPFEESIQEGSESLVMKKVHERSSKLHKMAVEYFTHNGHIACKCCGFDFLTDYGPKYAYKTIDIHHITPIYMYKDDDINKTIEQALNNLLPVCPNCHRIIHIKHINREGLPSFEEAIKSARSS